MNVSVCICTPGVQSGNATSSGCGAVVVILALNTRRRQCFVWLLSFPIKEKTKKSSREAFVLTRISMRRISETKPTLFIWICSEPPRFNVALRACVTAPGCVTNSGQTEWWRRRSSVDCVRGESSDAPWSLCLSWCVWWQAGVLSIWPTRCSGWVYLPVLLC